ncbi:MAG TPA: hypothetical protein VMU10_09265 [Desulfomonilia bacterium]|nr:hypothetical protein [Desulfomonilia bacterium]
MKNKVFLTVFIGVALIMGISSILVYTQLYTVQSVNLDPLTDSLYREDSKVLNWILSSIPLDKIDTLKLPDSWAEIFVVNNSDLNLVNSSNPAHKGMALHKHPLLLDQASVIIPAIESKKSSSVNTKDYMVVVQPLSNDQSIIALKPKAWERGLVAEHDKRLKSTTYGIFMILGIFLVVGVCITILLAFIISKMTVSPTRKAFSALEALSLGDFDYDIGAAKDKEMESFVESYLRLKTSLEMALEKISRR